MLTISPKRIRIRRDSLWGDPQHEQSRFSLCPLPCASPHKIRATEINRFWQSPEWVRRSGELAVPVTRVIECSNRATSPSRIAIALPGPLGSAAGCPRES